MLKIQKITFLYILCIVLFSCNTQVKQKDTSEQPIKESSLKYATGFDIQYFKDYTKLIIKVPYQNSKETFEYILVDSTQQMQPNAIRIPIKSVVVTSTTHIPMLELLNVENNLVGYPNTDYISSKRTRKLIDAGAIQELGNEENINTELLLDLHPDVVIGFSINSNNKMFTTIEKMGIPVILNGDWLEQTPLGRTEWIKLFGLLFGKEKQADIVFNDIENNYLEAKAIALESKEQPTLISGGLFKDIWNLPAGDSFEATYFRDANTNYIWRDSKGKGSLSFNIETVFDKGKNADIWVAPSFYTSREQLKKANDIYSQFKAFKEHHIYTFVTKKGALGGMIYFELAPARPDLVLKDLIKIAHPTLMEDYEFTFYEPLK